MLQGSKIMVAMAETYVKVKPGSDEFQVEFNDFPVIHLESEAENGRANHELVDRLQEILGERPGIVSGHHSRRKKIRVDLPEEEVIERLEKNG